MKLKKRKTKLEKEYATLNVQLFAHSTFELLELRFERKCIDSFEDEKLYWENLAEFVVKKRAAYRRKKRTRDKLEKKNNAILEKTIETKKEIN